MRGITADIAAWTSEMDRSTWIRMRRGGTGGSDVSSMIGCNKYRDIQGLFLDKQQSEFEPDADIIDDENQYMYWGHKLEPVVADESQIRIRELVGPYTVQEYQAFLTHPHYPFMLANIDRVVTKKDKKGDKAIAVLECKTCGISRAREWGIEKAPLGYIAQVMHYMMVTGLQEAYLACLIGGQRYTLKGINWDDAIVENIMGAEIDFWSHVQRNVMPLDISSEGMMARSLLEQGVEDGTLVTDIYDDNNR